MIDLSTLDYVIIFSFFALSLTIGLLSAKKAGENSTQFFLSGKNMPWWLLGVSMVATTFSTDTPNLVTDIVRTHGVSGNWLWWAFLLTGMLTVFVYAKLWRRSNVSTDLEFYELRYGGASAAFLRRFRALYLGIIFNVIIMSSVTLAAIKIGGVMLGLAPWETVLYAGAITVIFSTIGGFRGVVYTDFILFFVAMVGSIGSAVYLLDLPEVGGLSNLLANQNVTDKLSFLPDFSDPKTAITLFIIPLTVQWWSSWYPGSEPGGGGYVAQRMLAAKNENNAIAATFFFNIMHYAVRPWPWILVALASLVVFPDLQSIGEAFPHVAEDKLGEDLAYSAMLTMLPSGLLGLVLTSLVAAYMSTISTQLNWGSSYLVFDFYRSYIDPNASERKMVLVGRLATVLLMMISAILALFLNNALQLLEILLVFGAGTGLIFILRWFWWRINAWSEIVAMVASGLITLLLKLTPLGPVLFDEVSGVFPAWSEYLFVVGITTLLWVIATFVTPKEDSETLLAFCKRVSPGGPGWKKVYNASPEEFSEHDKNWNIGGGVLAMILGCVMIYGLLLSTGFWIYSSYLAAAISMGISLVAAGALVPLWKKIKGQVL